MADLFWTPIAVSIQTLASLKTLSTYVPMLSGWLDALGPGWVAQIETQFTAIALAICRYITLSSGLFQRLVKLQGAISHAEIASRAASRIFLFQLVLVLCAPRPVSRPAPLPHRTSRLLQLVLVLCARDNAA